MCIARETVTIRKPYSQLPRKLIYENENYRIGSKLYKVIAFTTECLQFNKSTIDFKLLLKIRFFVEVLSNSGYLLVR